MADLEGFRTETRAWLEANCPPEMREPVRDDADVYWGGRNASFKNDAQKRWMEVMAARGWPGLWPLAGLLLLGSVIGAQYGAILTLRLKPDLLRLALAIIILLVALRMALGLAWRPDEIYSIEYL